MDEADLKLNMMIFMDAMIGLTERDPTQLETGGHKRARLRWSNFDYCAQGPYVQVSAPAEHI